MSSAALGHKAFGDRGTLADRWLELPQNPNRLDVDGPRACVANRVWTFGGVTYATPDVAGSCNNLGDTNTDLEYAGRNAAGLTSL